MDCVGTNLTLSPNSIQTNSIQNVIYINCHSTLFVVIYSNCVKLCTPPYVLSYIVQ